MKGRMDVMRVRKERVREDGLIVIEKLNKMRIESGLFDLVFWRFLETLVCIFLVEIIGETEGVKVRCKWDKLV